MADAQYAIDIAAEFSEAGKTEAALDRLSSKLMGGGLDAKFFRDALDKVNGQLATTNVEFEESSRALADSNAKYAQLETTAVQAQKSAERAALKHADALLRLEKAASPAAQTRAAAAVEKHAAAMRSAQSAARQAQGALDSAADAHKRIEKRANAAATAQRKLKNQLSGLRTLQKKVNDRLGDAATNLSTFRGALGDVGGPLGELGERALFPAQAFVDLREKFSTSVAVMTVGVVGIAAVGAALLALAAAATAAAVALTGLGVALTNNQRSAALSREAFLALHPELTQTVEGFDEVTKATGVSSDKLTALTKKLQDAKVAAEDMPDALRAVAMAEAALGEGGADQFIGRIREAKGEVGDLANEVQAKFGGIVSRQMLSLEVQGARLRSNMGRLFGGLNIDPLLDKLSVITEMFNENTVIGRTLKAIWEGLAQPIVDSFTKAIPLVEAFFLGMLIQATKIYIFFKPLIKRVKELLGFDDTTSAETFDRFAQAGKIAAVVLIASIGGITAALGLLGVALLAAATVFAFPLVAAAALGAALYVFWDDVVEIGAGVSKAFWDMNDSMVEAMQAAGAWIDSVIDSIAAKFSGMVTSVTGTMNRILETVSGWIDSLVGMFSALDLSEIGSNIVASLARGIAGSAGRVVSAITGAVSGAINKAKSLLGIASPSKVFAEIGVNTGEGMAKGVEQTSGMAQDAMAQLVSPPVNSIALPPEVEIPDRFSAQSAQESGGGGSQTSNVANQNDNRSSSVSLDGVTFNFYGVENAQQAEPKLREALIQLLEGELVQSGGTA